MNTDQPTAENPSASETVETVKAKAKNLQECTTNYVRENPVGAVVGALAAGLVIGWLLPHFHRQRTWAERYVTGPAGHARDWLGSAAESASDGLHHASDRTVEFAHDAAGAVRRGLGKLRFW